MTHLLWLNLLLFWEFSPLRVIKEIVDAWVAIDLLRKNLLSIITYCDYYWNMVICLRTRDTVESLKKEVR